MAIHAIQHRFEILPFGAGEQEAAELPEPVRLTVTCSPKHGPDLTVDVGTRLRALGHAVTVHIAARMVRDAGHLDALLAQMAGAGIDDMFLVGGDVSEPLGEYASALELLPLIAGHPQRPSTIGVPGYPEGHPLIDDATLARVLREKCELADYITTQMCFHARTLREWIEAQRLEGIANPVLIGLPGKVKVARLFELSMRIGVGSSIGYLRKQHGIQHLFGRSIGDRLFDELSPALGDPRLAIDGFHHFTFNQLLDTWRSRAGEGRLPAVGGGGGGGG